ncbi:hypothetical protein [Amycolatopsis aidingensis]|uniref:hypothetical protein n=1 Tax=Amycolatopsis aidingensis TaxID=2842453 RepID=UPI001C0AB6A7|nr:hypothetical protein [Amycolatopsis aidingensis]
MTRFGTKLAAGTAALALTAGSGTAAAQDSSGVSEETGPVAFANAASMQVHDPIGQKKVFTLVTETQRSPLRTGVSALAQDNSTVPRSPEDYDTVGRHYRLSFGTFDPAGGLFPEGVPSREHRVTAALKDTTVPVATAEANYALQDLQQPSSGQDKTVLAFQGVRNTLECADPENVTGETTAEKLWVLDKEGNLAARDLPEGDQPLEVEGLGFGPPMDPRREQKEGDETKLVPVPYDRDLTTSDVSISRVTAFDQLLRQQEWRDGAVTGVAGWKVTITSHLRKEREAEPDGAATAENRDQAGATGNADQEAGTQDAADQATTEQRAAEGDQQADRGDDPRNSQDTAPEGSKFEDVGTMTTTLVLGGLSCSLPQGFTPVQPGGGGQQPSVPVKIPAGASSAPVSAAVADLPADRGGFPTGLVLIGGGLVLGAGALLTLRGRRRDRAAEPTE